MFGDWQMPQSQSIAPDHGSEAAHAYASTAQAPNLSMQDDSLYRKVSARVIPFLFVCYVV